VASCSCPKRFLLKEGWGQYASQHEPGKTYPGPVIFHDASCTFAAGLTGGEWDSRAAHEEGRAGADEAMAADYANIKKRATEAPKE
jgi:hypothetical protein